VIATAPRRLCNIRHESRLPLILNRADRFAPARGLAGRACAPPTAKHISAARTSDDQARLIADKVRGQHQITVIRSGLLGQAGTMLAWFIARGASPPHRKSMITS
jgi:hypothetical protein